MQAIQSRARLVERDATATVARPALPIRRAAVEEALRDVDGPVELTFDVVRVGGATEAISMIMERPDLERTLQSADGEELALVFDPDELERALEGSEVEAQGLRETAAVLTVAVAAMAGSAGVASAAGGASGTGYVVPAAGGAAIVNDAGAAGASGTGYVVPAGGAEAIVNDAGAAGASGTGYVIPAGGTEAIVNDAGAAAGASGTGYVVRRAARGDRQRCWRGGCEWHGLCHPGGRYGGDRERCGRGGGCERHGLCHPGRWHGGDRQRCRRGGWCEWHRLCRSGWRRRGDRQRCRRGRCERHRLCHPGRWHGGDRQRRRRNECDGPNVASTAEDGAALSSTETAAIGTGAILLVAGAAFAAARTKRRPDTPDVAPA